MTQKPQIQLREKVWPKKAFGVGFGGVARCPTCKYPLLVQSMIVDIFPYQHTDLQLVCKKCGWKGLFGVPVDPLFGMELIIWDSNPLEVLKQATQLEAPVCPYHLQPMTLTKVWGDKVMQDPQELRVQWKCSEWYLVENRTVTREAPSLHVYSQAEKQKFLKKLERLGYL